ncbi:hypothetical protein [Paenibacillus nasutitermitis]|uniref:Uncharacterized protein n=1 Tax=Paenibacillus nasutitermitis TaxID=1652958 RepID=A0A917DWZ2_9BACL|nr:hypothetical protein [Paenibacillus nasutitermitis]GGD75653.1 hypothetical protein GCM10010911_37040 [Paenibacillus nasutitermitis]
MKPTKEKDLILISAPNSAGEVFIRYLLQNKIPVAVMVNNSLERERISALGVQDIICINTKKEETWVVPDKRLGKVFLFESSLNLCCRYIQICRSWTSKPIYVVTGCGNPRSIYRGLGADYIIYTEGQDVSCLISNHLASDG